MRDTLELGPAPVDEDCAQLGADDYVVRAVTECRAYINQLHRVYEKIWGTCVPKGLRLHAKKNNHEYGVYYEVAASFDDSDEQAVDAIYWFEANLPDKWDEEAMVELKTLLFKK